MLTGVSFKHTDKRVDKMLLKRGIANADIYYSPIISWFLGCLLMLFTCAPIIIPVFSSVYSLLLIPYFLLAYLFNAHKNNSFALHGDELIVVNPNVPFRHVTVIRLRDIKHVTFDERKIRWQPLLLCISLNNLLIETKQGSKRYYCAGLEKDAFDENWVEKIIDGLETALKEKGIPTTFNIDY